MAQANGQPGAPVPPASRAFFEFWQPYRGRLALLQRSGLNLSGLLMPCFVGTVNARSSLPLFSIYSAGGFLAMLELFVQHPQITAQAMADRFADEFDLAVPTARSTA